MKTIANLIIICSLFSLAFPVDISFYDLCAVPFLVGGCCSRPISFYPLFLQKCSKLPFY
ncbi:hypothetical protein GYH30_011276 [Glycine max]|nr:hypothetical protein GYH30_011276 [Glycine max]